MTVKVVPSKGYVIEQDILSSKLINATMEEMWFRSRLGT